jgi:uncharacterized protein (TIGR02270 family)
MSLIPTILGQHAEEAALLWLRRDAAVGQPHFRVEDIAVLDNQLDAHLDGLRIAESNRADTGWTVCQHELGWGEPGEVFPAAVLALESGDCGRLDRVLEASAKSYENSRPLVSAFGWLPFDRVAEQIDHLLASEDAGLRRVGIAACAAHRCDPDRALAEALNAGDDRLRARALRAVGELGRVDLLSAVEDHVGEEDELSRSSAAWSVALISGYEAAVEALRNVVETDGPRRERALQTALRRMDVGAGREWINGLAQDARLVRSAVLGAGVLGIPDSIPWLFDQMQVPPVARVAGETFSMITGVDIAYQDLDGQWPEGFHAGPTEDPADENVEMDPDENLPWPDREKLTKWWRKHRDRFDSGTRYLVGRPMTIEWLNHVLRNGYQRQRVAAALELAIRQPGTPLFEVRAPGWRQRQLLG